MASWRICGLLLLCMAAAALPSGLAQADESKLKPGAQASAPVPSAAGDLEFQHVDFAPFDTVQVCFLLGLAHDCAVNHLDSMNVALTRTT